MPTMTMKSQYKPKITILSNNNANSFIIQCLEGIADIQYSNLDTALTKEILILIQWPKLLHPLIPQLIQIWY